MAAANQLVNEVGYDAMTMDDLAVRAGLSKPTLYQYFGSKQAIWIRAVIDRIECAGEFAKTLDPAIPPIERLEQVAHHVFVSTFGNAYTSVGPAVRAVMIPALKASPEYKKSYGEMFASMCDIVDEARAQGSIASGIPTRFAVQVIISILRDGEYSEYVDRGECSPERLAKTLVRIVLQGITTRNPASTTLSNDTPSSAQEAS
jgi:AcrR family transcriptional regulator